jgi:hypothetical protein
MRRVFEMREACECLGAVIGNLVYVIEHGGNDETTGAGMNYIYC